MNDEQRATLKFIIDYRDEHGYPPTVTEIADGLGEARSTIGSRLAVMLRAGIITRPEGSIAARARAIGIPGDVMKTITETL